VPWRAIAASVAIVLLAGAGWLWSGQQSLSTQAGEQLLVELPDGSTSLLNGLSTLAYNIRLWSWRRRVNLTGEAFFTVEKGAAFRVTTQQGTVEVLGTSFNVYDRPSGYEVHCQTGRVAVRTTAAPTPVVLSPLESVRYVDGSATQETYTPTTGPGWQEGVNRYTSSPLSRVITDLTAQFNLEFELEGVDVTQQYSGAFVHDDADTALEMVFAPLGITPTRNGRIVRLAVTN
ncbi:MAG: FecR domain-containing protein, partial [Bacteroidota bacterium]